MCTRCNLLRVFAGPSSREFKKSDSNSNQGWLVIATCQNPKNPFLPYRRGFTANLNDCVCFWWTDLGYLCRAFGNSCWVQENSVGWQEQNAVSNSLRTQSRENVGK